MHERGDRSGSRGETESGSAGGGAIATTVLVTSVRFRVISQTHAHKRYVMSAATVANIYETMEECLRATPKSAGGLEASF